ncbi:hypothetical protein D3C75_689080 [compost metagenome]
MHADAQRAGVLYGADRDLPHQFVGLEVDGRHGAERWFLARNADCRKETFAHGAKRCAFLWHHAHFNAAGSGFDLVARNHVVGQAQAHVVDEHVVGVRINRDAAPVHAAQRARELQGAVHARRGVDAFVAHAFELDAAHQLVKRRGAPHVGFGQGLVAD